MIIRRALVVDDSKSARFVLSRTLKTLGLVVDAVESAEAAIDYLQTQRPDIIYMDYLLTGMDGLAAIRIIKANPATRDIPAFMYTSQAESAFGDTAKLAGALGILPKTFGSADVVRTLQLARGASDGSKPLASQQPSRYPARASVIDLSIIRGSRSSVLLLVLVMCCLVVLALNHSAAPTRTANSARGTASAASSSSASPATSVPSLSIAATRQLSRDVEPIPYGEVPLSGSRAEHLRLLLLNLRDKGFRGMVRVEVFTGDFCLSGDPLNGYRIALPSLTIDKCDLLGNPFADVLSVQQRQSAAFEQLLAQHPSGDIRIELAEGGRQLATPYPPHLNSVTAAEWNLAASRNHRVEFSVLAP